MNLELARYVVPGRLAEELGFAFYLSFFATDLPILPGKILGPMTTAEGIEHFRVLAGMEKKIIGRTVFELLDLSRLLPNLDLLLPVFAAGRLEQYHLFELGSFLDADERLAASEQALPLHPGALDANTALQRLLRERTGADYGTLKAGDEAERLRGELALLERELKKKIAGYEEEILAETGLAMVFPWPRELALSRDEAIRISSCSLLTMEQKEDVWLLGYAPGPELTDLTARREVLSAELEEMMAGILAAINRELQRFYSDFADYYRRRCRRAWQYLLLSVKIDRGFSWPVFTETPGGSFLQAYIPAMQARKKERCIPLDLDLAGGANVLFGAHMSGKTTVLKTLYFVLSLIRVGLPVPAALAMLNYPEHVALMLKSSGNMQRDLSAFGEEVAFFTGEIPDGAWLLADELFLSTDPVNGAILSEIFIKAFAAREMVFLCTTHYPAVLDINGISLSRMLDCELPERGDRADLPTLLEKMPYRLEKIVGDEEKEKIKHNTGPLEVALLFALPSEIKQKIREALDCNAKEKNGSHSAG